jgi:6-phosphofructokinase 1
VIRRQKLKIQLIGVPSSIDNDIPFVDKSFGFETAIAESIPFINAANVEAEGAELGVGIVRIMGNNCGFIAANASLASRDVNICIVPELRFQLYGPHGVYESILERAKVKGHCIIVVAEGAFRGLVDEDKTKILEQNGFSKLQESNEWQSPEKNAESDPFVDLANFIKSDLNSYAAKHHKVKCTIKYLDPKKAIRACPPNPLDITLCHTLAQSAVHSGMAGYTDFAVGFVRC